jgi:glycine/D-amino acid oxidase-like deaminating enzyme
VAGSCAAVEAAEAGAKVVVLERAAAVWGASVMSGAADNVIGHPGSERRRSRQVSGWPWPTGFARVAPPDRAAVVDERKQGLAKLRENGLFDPFPFHSAELAETFGVEQ